MSVFKRSIILFFSTLILSLPIVNELHFLLVDHEVVSDTKTTKVIHHQCSDFCFYTVYIANRASKIQIIYWIEGQPSKLFYGLANFYGHHEIFDLKNKGPPMLTIT